MLESQSQGSILANPNLAKKLTTASAGSKKKVGGGKQPSIAETNSYLALRPNSGQVSATAQSQHMMQPSHSVAQFKKSKI